jgi:hypothetical protein
MKIFLKLVAFAVFSAAIVSARMIPAWAVAKNETPPGQSNKTEKNPNSNESENPSDKIKSVKPTLKPEVKPLKVQQFLVEKTKPETVPVAQLGTAKLKDLLRESTASGTLTVSGKKYTIREMKTTAATAGATMRRRAIQGIITGLGANRIIISHQTQQEKINSVYYNPNTVFKLKGQVAPTATDLAIGMRIAASGEIVEGALLAARIHVIPGKAIGMFEKNPVASSGGGSDILPTPATASAITTPEITAAAPTATLAPTVIPEPTATLPAE